MELVKNFLIDNAQDIKATEYIEQIIEIFSFDRVTISASVNTAILEACGYHACGYLEGKVIGLFKGLIFNSDAIQPVVTNPGYVVLKDQPEPLSVFDDRLRWFLIPVSPRLAQSVLIQKRRTDSAIQFFNL